MLFQFSIARNNIILTFVKGKLNETGNDDCYRSLRKKPMVFRAICPSNVFICKCPESAARCRSKTYKSNDSHKYAIISWKTGCPISGINGPFIRVGGDGTGGVVVDRTRLQNC